MTARAVAAGVILLLLCALAAVFYLRADTGPTWRKLPLNGFQEMKKRWADYFASHSPGEAYGEFLRESKDMPYEDGHTLSHVIGELLYEHEREEGLRFCSADFGYGCYHGFAGASLYARGLSAVPKLSVVCESSKPGFYLGCIHGIGHGILAYLGNDKLLEALEACKDAQKDEFLGGCFGGVFMEYNYNTMQSSDGIALRPFSESDAHKPCVDVPEEFRLACYYEQPAWWRASFESAEHGAEKGHYTVVGKLCDTIAGDDERIICFRGIGNVIGPKSGYRATVAKEWCSALSHERARDICFHEALNHLFQSDDGRGQLKEMCASGDVVYGDICRSDRL